MMSFEKIVQKFQLLDEYIGLLQKIEKIPLEEFLKDKIIIGSAKYYLQVSIECCLDAANHIIASERFRSPRDYADSFKILQEEGLISDQLGLRLRQMAKLRNRLVHLYGQVDDKSIHKFIREDLKDIEDFRSVVIEKYRIRNSTKI
jgi:uncharacterized protein YutE (UPF0331/DUF86 family)